MGYGIDKECLQQCEKDCLESTAYLDLNFKMNPYLKYEIDRRMNGGHSWKPFDNID